MKIDYIEIENFRGIHHLHLAFGSRMNVFVGENGAGKSSVLTALKYLLSWFSARMIRREGIGIYIKEEDITNGAPFCRLQLRLSDGTYWKLFKQRAANRETAQDRTDLVDLTRLTDSLVEKNAYQKGLFPIVCHYGVNRAVAEVKPLLHRKSRLSSLDAYDGKLDNGTNFNKFFDWFREREDIENAAYRNSGRLEEDIQLKAVKKALESILPGFGRFHVSREPRSFMLTKGDVELSIEQLSDGEKCYLTLVGDIARMLSMANPLSPTPLSGTGCVLIDEIDLHLHPRWQSEVVSRLSDIFPNCQFFLTTHSTFVVSNVKSFENDHFILMRKGEAVEVSQNTYGLRVDEILTEFFQVGSLRNQDVQSHIETIWKCLADGDQSSETFQNSLSWLKRHLNPSDIEFVRINMERAKQQKH